MATLKVLIVGSGAREAALGLAFSRSSIKHFLDYTASKRNVTLESLGTFQEARTTEQMISVARFGKYDLCVVGPEVPLAEGFIDTVKKYSNTLCIGMPSNVAKIETDKAWCRSFLHSLGHSVREFLPEWTTFDSKSENIRDEIAEYQKKFNGFVIKPSGLAGGKGVKVSGDHLKDTDEGHSYVLELLSAGQDVVLEQKLVGTEFSLMSLTDGEKTIHFPIVQDFKRAFDGDQGPNTGGMGCVCDYGRLSSSHFRYIREAEKFNSLVAQSLAQEFPDSKFTGVLFGGFMVTDSGSIKLLEYNCRFGDPEIIAALASIDADIDVLKILFLAADGQLKKVDPFSFQWKRASNVTYVVPSSYPDQSIPISFPFKEVSRKAAMTGLKLIGASLDMRYMTDNSRTLAILNVNDGTQSANSDETRQFLQANSDLLQGFRWRSDISSRASDKKSAYAKVGVDIDSKMSAIDSIQPFVRSTFHQHVVDIPQGFGGLCRVPGTDRIMVSSTDSVGSKTELIRQLSVYFPTQKHTLFKGLGHDIVNHCVNDILVMGCTSPITFLDYFASHSLNENSFKSIVEGLSEACKAVGCAIVGGETAEIKDTYQREAIDLAGFINGIMTESELLTPRTSLAVGDVVIALPSVSPHTNGYTLINSLFRDAVSKGSIRPVESSLDLLLNVDKLSWFERLARSHKCYLNEIKTVRAANIPIKGLVHITGGGLIDNPPRILPDGLGFYLSKEAIYEHMSDDFKRLRRESGITSDTEMFKTFNSGIGMLIVVDQSHVGEVTSLLDGSWLLGNVVQRGSETVEIF